MFRENERKRYDSNYYVFNTYFYGKQTYNGFMQTTTGSVLRYVSDRQEYQRRRTNDFKRNIVLIQLL